MILKIEKIKGVGNYENYVASGDVTLKKSNFIYAENGAGKTTLSRILDSMSHDDPKIINNHVRIGFAAVPEVQIKSATRVHVFNGTKWNVPKPEVAVFDAHFVANNVYTGFEISNDHRKHLYKFVLGDAGVDIAKQIEDVKKEIDTKNLELREKEQSILVKCGRYNIRRKGIEELLKLSKLDDIDNLIASKEKELQISQNSEVILRQSALNKLNGLPNISDEYFAKIKKMVETSIDDIGQEYLDLVSNHIKNLLKAGMADPSGWVKAGLDSMGEKQGECPMCGQPLENVTLIKGYNQFFNKRYTEVSSSVLDIIKFLGGLKFNECISQLELQFKNVVDNHRYWESYMNPPRPLPVCTIDRLEVVQKYAAMMELLEKKRIAPVIALKSETIDSFFTVYSTLKRQVEEVNSFIESYDESISSIKSKIRPKDEIESELADLRLNKQIYSDEVRNDLSSYKVIKQDLKRLETDNKNLQKHQKEISDGIVASYGVKINDYLENVFHTNYKIVEIKDGGIRGRAKEANLSYTLTFNGTQITLDGETNTSFKNVLSEGDKNTIAFSFFLAKLRIDAGLGDKIVVFDDPLSSLDQNRRRSTIDQLARLYKDCKQLIVLSHNLHFLIDLDSNRKFRKGDKKVLRILKRQGKSTIVEFELKKEWMDKYKKAKQSMILYVENPDPEKKEDALKSMRLALETFIKLKFCCQIDNTNETFGNVVAALKSKKDECKFSNPDKDSVIDGLDDLVENTWQVHHAGIEEWDEDTDVVITDEESVNYVSRALKMLDEDL